jgi:hypothetical protein
VLCTPRPRKDDYEEQQRTIRENLAALALSTRGAPVSPLLIFLLSLQVLFAGPNLASQGQGQKPLGSLSTSGEVYLNESRITGEVIIFLCWRFAADRCRRGASVAVSGCGTLTIAKQTEVSFAASPRYFDELLHGAVGFQTFVGTTNFELRAGNFIIVPASDTEAAAAIERTPDGLTKVVYLYERFDGCDFPRGTRIDFLAIWRRRDGLHRTYIV